MNMWSIRNKLPSSNLDPHSRRFVSCIIFLDLPKTIFHWKSNQFLKTWVQNQDRISIFWCLNHYQLIQFLPYLGLGKVAAYSFTRIKIWNIWNLRISMKRASLNFSNNFTINILPINTSKFYWIACINFCSIN